MKEGLGYSAKAKDIVTRKKDRKNQIRNIADQWWLK